MAKKVTIINADTGEDLTDDEVGLPPVPVAQTAQQATLPEVFSSTVADAAPAASAQETPAGAPKKRGRKPRSAPAVTTPVGPAAELSTAEVTLRVRTNAGKNKVIVYQWQGLISGVGSPDMVLAEALKQRLHDLRLAIEEA